MSDSAFDDYLVQWRTASPQRRVAWLFLSPAEQIRYGALAALEREWSKAVHEAREPQVAATKLGWWREEMQRALPGQARHPLTQRLFADARAQGVPLHAWTAPVDAALAELNASPPVDFTAQCAAAAPFAEAIAALETQVWFGVGVVSPRAARVTLLTQLIGRLRALLSEVAHARTPVPMNLLARHGLTIEHLGQTGPARDAALQDYTTLLERELADATRMQGALTLFRTIDLQQDAAMLGRATRAADPLAALQKPDHGLRGVLKIWRAARTWRGMASNESSP